MIPFLTNNKRLAACTLFFLIIIPLFGLNFLVSFIGNILLLVILIPILVLIIAFISLNSFKAKVKICDNCGTISLGVNDICSNCGFDLGENNIKNNDQLNKPSETTIEVKAEEVK